MSFATRLISWSNNRDCVRMSVLVGLSVSLGLSLSAGRPVSVSLCRSETGTDIYPLIHWMGDFTDNKHLIGSLRLIKKRNWYVVNISTYKLVHLIALPAYRHTGIQRQREKQTDDRQTDRQTDNYRPIDRQTGRQTEDTTRRRYRYRHTDTSTYRDCAISTVTQKYLCLYRT